MRIVLAAALLLTLAPVAMAQAPADRARAALALAQAPRPPQAPPMRAEAAHHAPPASVQGAYERMRATVPPCSPACECGCNAGRPCDPVTCHPVAALAFALLPVVQAGPLFMPGPSFGGGGGRSC